MGNINVTQLVQLRSIESLGDVNRIWKEYGLIALLIVISVGGYLLFFENKQDIMSYTLDVLEEKMVALASDDTSRERIASLFDHFSEQVAQDDITAQHIESVAANVLNLSARGEAITAEEAETVLSMDFQMPLPTPESPEAESTLAFSTPEPPVSEEEKTELNDRLTKMLELAEVIQIQSAGVANHIKFSTDADGIYAILDSDVEQVVLAPTFLPMARDMAERELVRWKEHLAPEREAEAEKYKARREMLYQIRQQSMNDLQRSEHINRLERIQRLGALGMNVGPDTSAINLEVNRIVSEAMPDLDSLMKQLQSQLATTADSVRAASANN